MSTYCVAYSNNNYTDEILDYLRIAKYKNVWFVKMCYKNNSLVYKKFVNNGINLNQSIFYEHCCFPQSSNSIQQA